MTRICVGIVCIVDEGPEFVYYEFEVVVAVDGVVKHIGLILSFGLHDGRFFFDRERFINLLGEVV